MTVISDAAFSRAGVTRPYLNFSLLSRRAR